MQITLTAHERNEWSRCANAMYANGCNQAGHMLSAASAVGTLEVGKFDRAASIYRAWLAFNEFPK